MPDIPRERFDRDIQWPERRPEPPAESTHPDRTPDIVDGPFTYAVRRLDDPDDIGVVPDEIGYEGER